MRLIGYSLIKLSDNGEVKFYSTLPDSYVIPDPDNPDLVLSCHSDVLLDQENFGHKLVSAYADDSPPGQFYAPNEIVYSSDGARTVRTYVYPSEPNVTPQSISALQLRRGLRSIGKYDAVTQYVQSAAIDIQDVWDYANTYYRNDPLWDSVISTLNMTEKDLDDLFRLSSTL